MALLGPAALAMWWNMAHDRRAEFEHWHAHEHFPERLAIPGFLRASRWHAADGGEGFFVMYELASHAVLSSPDYLARLNAPSPWSTQLMPHHRDMVRTQCHVLDSRGAFVARHALTLRLSPAAGQETGLRRTLAELAASLVGRPGLVGLHLLQHAAPAIGPTREQAIRGHADQAADWVLVACGYDLAALRELGQAELSDDALAGSGAAGGAVRGLYLLSQSALPSDMP